MAAKYGSTADDVDVNKNTHRHGRRCTYLLYDPIIELQGSWAQLELAILMMGLAFQFKARWSAAKLQVVSSATNGCIYFEYRSDPNIFRAPLFLVLIAAVRTLPVRLVYVWRSSMYYSYFMLSYSFPMRNFNKRP